MARASSDLGYGINLRSNLSSSTIPESLPEIAIGSHYLYNVPSYCATSLQISVGYQVDPKLWHSLSKSEVALSNSNGI